MSIRKEIYDKMIKRAAPLFGMKPEEMTEETRFAEDCKAKSTHISQITTYLEDEFDTEIPFMSFRRQKTIGDAVDYVLVECLEEEPEEDGAQEEPAAAEAVSRAAEAPQPAPQQIGRAHV